MDKKTIKILSIVFIILIFIAGGIFWGLKLFEKESYEDLQDYTPQEEISTAQLRKTIISLFFKSKDTDELNTEARMIDAKLLLNDPYTLLLTMLIQGPQNENNVALIPSNTIINSVELIGDTLEIDLSDAFVEEFEGNEVQMNLAMKSILSTLTQFNEVNNVNILVNGEAIICDFS